ncbi:hypothetical protein IKG12_01915 [Candidatus Saccharibacteria bacterium]|nr:hypothetical protein [Candidatus Saccharibacteria bacterium]
MNNSEIQPAASEQKEIKGKDNAEFRRRLGKETLLLFDLYGSDKLERLEYEKNLPDEDAAEKQKEIDAIQAERSERSEALKRGRIGFVGYYNKHPENIGEIVIPGMKHDAEYYRKQFDDAIEKHGKASFGRVVDEYLRVKELSGREDLKNLTEEALAKEEAMLRSEQDEMFQRASAGVLSQEQITENMDALNAKMKDFLAKKNDFAEYSAIMERIAASENAGENADVKAQVESAETQADQKQAEAESADKAKEAEVEEIEEVKEAAEDLNNEVTGSVSGNIINISPEEFLRDPDAAFAKMSSEYSALMAQKNRKAELAVIENYTENVSAEERADIERRVEEKDKKVNRIAKKLGSKIAGSRFGRFVAAAAAVVMVMASLQGCTEQLSKYPFQVTDPAKVASATAEEALNAKEVPGATFNNGMNEAQTESTDDSAEDAGGVASEQVKTPEYNTNFFATDKDSNRRDLTQNLYNKVTDGSSNPFDVEARAKGEAQTADKKESEGAFGVILSAAELDGNTDALEDEYLAKVMERSADQRELLAYRSVINKAFDSIKGREFGTGNSIDGMMKLNSIDGKFSLDNINRDAHLLEMMSESDFQAVYNAYAEAEQQAWEGKESRAVEVTANTPYITAHIEKVTSEAGVTTYKLAVGNSRHSEAFQVIQRVNENGENEYDMGETKLNILKAHNLVPADMSLEDAQNKGYFKKYTVLGERNKCGGQMVIKENITKKKTKKKVEVQTPVVEQTVVENPFLFAVTTTTGTTPDIPTPPGSTPPPPRPDPQPELKPKTDENHQGDDADPNATTTPEWTDEDKEHNVQAGEETVPPDNTEGVNENPSDQQDWEEEPTPAPEDTNTGGERNDTTPENVDEAARRAAEMSAQ